jgi:hypothetical protein
MPRGGARPGSGPIKGAKYVKAKPLDKLPADIRSAARKSGVSPLDFMLAVMNDENEDMNLRSRMAIAAAPYIHSKPGDVAKGKKEQAEEAAETAGVGTDWGDDLAATVN